MAYVPSFAENIPDVIQRLTEIDKSLDDDDGVKSFNLLYLRVTQSVDAAVNAAHFHDPQWISQLDVVFANLYFRAFRAATTGIGSVPAAWQPLFASRQDQGIFKIQYALAGMNAHINRDLPVALAQMASDTGGYPSQASAQFEDFEAVDPLLEVVETQIKGEFLAGLQVPSGLSDVIAMWNVEKARDIAWDNGGILWHLQSVPPLADAFLDGLDHTFGLAGRGLLVHV